MSILNRVFTAPQAKNLMSIRRNTGHLIKSPVIEIPDHVRERYAVASLKDRKSLLKKSKAPEIIKQVAMKLSDEQLAQIFFCCLTYEGRDALRTPEFMANFIVGMASVADDGFQRDVAYRILNASGHFSQNDEFKKFEKDYRLAEISERMAISQAIIRGLSQEFGIKFYEINHFFRSWIEGYLSQKIGNQHEPVWGVGRGSRRKKK